MMTKIHHFYENMLLIKVINSFAFNTYYKDSLIKIKKEIT